MSPFLDDLEAQLEEAAQARAAARRSTASSWRRRVSGGARTAAVTFAIAVAFAVAAVVLTLAGQHHAAKQAAGGPPPAVANNGLPPPGSNPSPQGGTLGYINAALHATAQRDPACEPGPRMGPQPPVTASDGTPSRSLLAVLGVLRRPASGAVPQYLARGLGTDVASVYVRYTRLAQVQAGTSYYLVPEHLFGSPFAVPVRCFAEERTALQDELPLSMPAAKRSKILRTQAQLLAQQRQAQRGVPTGPHDGVALVAGGDGLGAATASELEQQGVIGSSGATAYGMAPDRVASVELTLPKAAGHGSVVVTVPVINNVFIANEPAIEHPIGMVWLARDGSVIKRFNLDQ